LPEGVIETIEEVQEHGSNIARRCPIKGRESVWVLGQVGNWVEFAIDVPSGVVLPGVSASPNCHRGDIEHDETRLGSDRSAPSLDIKSIAEDQGTNDLSRIVEKAVQSSGANIETSAIDTVLLVGVEPIGAPEHWEQKDDKWLESQCLPKTIDLGLPSGVLHQDDLGVVWSDDVLSIAKEQSKASTHEHEYDEADVSTICDSASLCLVDILTEWNLRESVGFDDRKKGPGRRALHVRKVNHLQNKKSFLPDYQ
jgi:hypothetical protein